MDSSPAPSALARAVSKTSIYNDAQQAGRSESNLHAHRISKSFSRNSTPNLLRKHANLEEEPPMPSVDTPSPEAGEPSRPRASLMPSQTSSSLGSSLSHNSSNSDRRTFRTGSEGSTSDSPNGHREMASAAAGTVLASDLAPPRMPAARDADMVSRGSSSNLSRLGTPRTVRDLGSDYTRYFNPFDTRNNSASDLGAPLPRDDSTARLLPNSNSSNRLSDPFRDEKQTSHVHEHKAPALATVTASTLPFSQSRNAMIDSADPEKAFFPYLDDRLGAPGAESQGYTFPMYWDEKEDDDDMHLPMIDDDKKLKPRWRDHFTRDNVVSTFGMLFMLLGLLCVFVALPVISSTGISIIDYTNKDTPLDQMGNGNTEAEAWATVNNRTYPLMTGVRTGLIDPDTPESAKTRTAIDGSTMNLVFSDEFNSPNRSFYPGDDPFWFGVDLWYGATVDLEWYDPDAISTYDGTLTLQLDAFPNHGLQYRSGMLNSWNQLCFKGGVFEVSVSLPGPGGVHGLWPGVWTMGNLGRPGYLATTDGMWPYTYNECDVGITPNQSMTDGTSKLPGQRLTSCGCEGSDHPTPGTGRGAPEIDIIEVSGDWGGLGVAVATQSYQVAPFDIWWYPNYEFMETPDYSTSFVNTYTGGPFQQAVSTTTMLNNSWYDGMEYQKYAFEYSPGGNKTSGITWYVGDEETMRFDARAIGPNGNIGQRLVSEEPMSLVMNLGISNNWVDINWAALKFPTIMRIDYVRWYQKEGEESVTCDPPGYETTQYIADHPEAYNNPNYTHWTDIPGYTWPKNTLMNTC